MADCTSSTAVPEFAGTNRCVLRTTIALSSANGARKYDRIGFIMEGPVSLNNLNQYPCQTVEYMGIPYADARCVDGVWYFRDINGEFRRFTFQKKVQPQA
jgi:hypothetical protein